MGPRSSEGSRAAKEVSWVTELLLAPGVRHTHFCLGAHELEGQVWSNASEVCLLQIRLSVYEAEHCGMPLGAGMAEGGWW